MRRGQFHVVPDFLPAETWRPVFGWEQFYEVSDLGRIRSMIRVGSRTQPNKKYGGYLLRPSLTPNGYLVVYLISTSRQRVRRYVHRLVLEAFVGPQPAGKEGAHNNGIRVDCGLLNLRWATRSENHSDKNSHGTQFRGETAPMAKLTDELVRKIRTLCGSMSDAKIARNVGVCAETVRNVRLRKTWTHVE